MYTEVMTEKQSTRLEQELPEADPGEGEGSVRLEAAASCAAVAGTWHQHHSLK